MGKTTRKTMKHRLNKQALLKDADTMTVPQLAEKYGKKINHIRYILSLNKKKAVRSRVGQMRAKNRHALIIADAASLTLQEIANKHDMSYGSVHSILTKNGVKAVRKGYERTRKMDKVPRSFLVLGALISSPCSSDNSISKTFCVSREYVGQIRALGMQIGALK